MQLFILYILYIYKSKNYEDNMGIQVAKTESGWTITKDGSTFSVTDKNKNGQWDSDELIKSLSGKGYLNGDELYEAKYQIAQLGDGVTPEQMAAHERYQQQKAAQQAQQQQQTTVVQGKQKGKFWRGLSLGLTAMVPLFSSLTGMFAGMSMNNWSYNCGNTNDTFLKISGGITGSLFGLSASLPLVAGLFMNNQTVPQQTTIYNNNINSLGFNTAGLYGAMSAQTDYLKQWQENIDKTNEEAAKAREKQAKEQQEKADRDYINGVIERVTPKNAIIDAGNKEYIKSLRDLDGERVYTEEEMANVEKINNAELIPYRHIGDDASDKTKLSPAFSQSLNELLLSYEEATGDKKYDIMPKEAYTEVTTIISKEKLTAEDVEKLKELYQKYEENIPSDEE